MERRRHCGKTLLRKTTVALSPKPLLSSLERRTYLLRRPLRVDKALMMGLALATACREGAHPHSHDGSVDAPGLPALTLVDLPEAVQAEVHPAVGARTSRPVAIVLSDRGQDCQRVLQSYGGDSHVVCSLPAAPSGGAQHPDRREEERHVLEAMELLKSSYAPYIAGSPVHLFVGVSHTDVGLRMLLREPSVFGYSFFAGRGKGFTESATWAALVAGRARVVLKSGEYSPRTAVLARTARRHGLFSAALGPGDVAWSRAVRTLRRADPRLTSITSDPPQSD